MIYSVLLIKVKTFSEIRAKKNSLRSIFSKIKRLLGWWSSIDIITPVGASNLMIESSFNGNHLIWSRSKFWNHPIMDLLKVNDCSRCQNFVFWRWLQILADQRITPDLRAVIFNDVILWLTYKIFAYAIKLSAPVLRTMLYF